MNQGDISPFPFQDEVINEIDWFGGRVLCALDMGLGKTAISLFWLNRHPKYYPCVVVCPASVKYVWEAESWKAVRERAIILEGQKPYFVQGKLFVINYDILPYWLDELKRIQPRTIIIDECQYIANQSNRNRAVWQLCTDVPYILGLSGTPILNGPIELFPMLNILHPSVFESRFDFGNTYCSPTVGRWGIEYKGASKSKELHQLLKSTCMVRRRKVDVLKDLPPKLRAIIPIMLFGGMDEYDRANLDFLNWLSEIDPKAAKRAEKAEAYTKVGYLLRLVAKLKLPGIINYINDWSSQTDEKLVVFANHKKMIEGLANGCKERHVIIDGDVPTIERKLIVSDFQTNPKTRLCIGNMEAAGVGINLTAARNVLFTELGFVPAKHTQAEDRCYRIGTTDTVWCKYAIAKGTIENRLCGIIQRKQDVSSTVLDGSKMEDDLNIMDLLLQEIHDAKGVH